MSDASRSNGWSDVRDALSFLGGYWPLYVISVILSIGANLAYGPGIAYTLAMLTDSIGAGDLALVWTSARWLALAAVAMGGLSGLGYYLSSWALEAAGLDMRRRVMSPAIRTSLSHWHTHKTGDIVSLLANDTETAKQGLSLLQNFISEVVLIVSCIVTLFVWGPGTALALLILAALCVVVGACFAGPVRKVSEEYQSGLGRTTSAATELFSGIAVVKSLRAERTALDRIRRLIDGLHLVALRRARLLGFQQGATDIANGLSSIGVFLASGVLALQGRLTIGQAIGVMQLASLPLSVFSSLGASWAAIQQNLAASRRVTQATKIPVEQGPPPDTATVSDPAAEPAADCLLEFERVTFGYVDDSTVLDGVSFHLGRRQKVALIGPSGGGKTSVLRLIQRFYQPSEGAIRLQGKDISLMPLRELRGQVGLVPQEAFIFPGTVRENIAMGKESASEEEIIASARLANAHEFILRLPTGYDTVLAERGGNLSGGQKQRICLARAFLKGADLLLLDEPTSSVDAESEALIRQSVDEYTSRGTVLVVSHTEGITSGADVVLSVGGGKIMEVEQG